MSLKGQPKINDIEEQAKLDLGLTQAMRGMEDTVMAISKEPDQLVAFAYELRRQDLEDKYSFEFINGNVKPSILVDIIMSNYWDKDEDCMKVKKTDRFRICIGQTMGIQFKKEGSGGQTPIVIGNQVIN